MQCFNGVAIAARSFLVAISVVALFSVNNVSAQDVGSRIEVMICAGADQSRFAVTAPQSDSIVSEPKITINGEVEYISQIDFFIDDVYNNTIALGYSETTFNSEITLSPGTHTIKFVATDSCSNVTHNDSLVITYQPKTQPSVGSNVETVVDGRVTPAVNDETIQADQTFIERIIDQLVTAPIIATGNALDIPTFKTVDTISEPTEGVRSLVFISGATLTLTAIALHAGMLSMLPVKAMYLTRHRHGLTGISVAAGIGLMAIVFML